MRDWRMISEVLARRSMWLSFCILLTLINYRKNGASKDHSLFWEINQRKISKDDKHCSTLDVANPNSLLFTFVILSQMLRLLSRRAVLSHGIKYSRFYLEDLAIDRQAIKREEQSLKEQQRLQSVFSLPANDSNPNNYLKVRLNNPLLTINPKKEYLKDSVWILEPKPIEIMPKVTITATRKYIITSMKKAKEALMFIKKRHVLDAINRLERSHRKVAKVLVRTFYNLIDHAKRKGLNPTRLWVHGCLIGKTKRYKGVRYAARGRGFREKRDFCQVKVICYEKSEKEYFQEIAVGECAPGISNLVRYTLKSQQADYQTLSKFTGVTTARGKQQAKLIFKRKVDQIMLTNKSQQKYEPRKVVQARLKEQLGEKMKEKFTELDKQEYSSLRIRERLYKKNMGL